MNILYVMIPLSLVLVVAAGWAFFWAVGSGQFDDLESPAWEVLREPSDTGTTDVSAGEQTAEISAAADADRVRTGARKRVPDDTLAG
ncbi:hypothetical protein ACG33_11095 [Steroidobacter denitrificans]|uniref:Cytochrome oxidase maturation protein Cbb3 n=1 Tax=Steroidobacter denitrificans TaxID=465721 RepID=A0A127FDD6_STEDE|nr:cbb3-type cytochrome oxidase assembly protein CcoS [Steroidobacter denitrificans]AMN47635.1 hypothetical protein ACG33_11095 [Steroidobacter denitrificans]